MCTFRSVWIGDRLHESRFYNLLNVIISFGSNCQAKLGKCIWHIFNGMWKSSLFESSSGNHNHFLSLHFRSLWGGGLKLLFSLCSKTQIVIGYVFEKQCPNVTWTWKPWKPWKPWWTKSPLVISNFKKRLR